MENNQDKKTEFEDIYSDSKKKPTYKKGHKPLEEREVYYPTKFSKFMLENNKRNTKIIFAALIVLVLGLVIVFGAAVFNEKFNMMLKHGEGYSGAGDGYTTPYDELEEYTDSYNEPIIEMGNQSSIDGILKQWYNLGGIMDQDYVTNVLLLGIDGKNGVKNGGNSDSMILVSINRKTEKITLVSFMRDSRTYYNNADNSGKDVYAKMNSAFGRGGAEGTVRVIENNYKIDIDYYVAVDFSLFSDLVDALGGVTVDVKEYEQKYINRTTSKIKKIPNYGNVTLNGDQALVYCRIRKCDADGDVSRTRRQRTFISALIKSVKGASISQLNKAVDAALPHVLTNCPKDVVLDFAKQAIGQAWYNYEIVQITMPDETTRKSVHFPETHGGKAYNIFYWVVDYPVAAQHVQQAIYGTTNITLDGDRNSVFEYVQLISQNNNKPESTKAPDYSDESTSDRDETATGEGEESTTDKLFYEDWFTKGEEESTAPPEEETTVPSEENTTSVPDEGVTEESAA